MNRSATVAAELGLRLVVPEHGGVPLTASICYRGDDPYAIRMSFHVGMDEPVEWIFARDLLATGMETPAGEGDVRVWPSSCFGQDVLNISLARGRLQAFVDSTLSALGTASPLVILVWGAVQVLQGHLTLGTMLAMNALAAGFLTPLSTLITNAFQFQLLGSYLVRRLWRRQTH